MYEYVASRRQHGTFLPRWLGNRCSTYQIVAKALCSNYTDVVTIDTLDGIPKTYPTAFSDNREVKEIVLVDQLVCVLMKNGIARCYDATDGVILCELNPVDTSSTHFAVHNPANQTLIIAYSCLPAHLQCKVVLVEALKSGKLESPAYAHQFECVVLRHPAFFEFCGEMVLVTVYLDIGNNKRIGVADLYKHVYRFWSMYNYQPVFEIQGQGYQEIRVSNGVVVMLSQPRRNILPLSLYDIEDGTLLASRELEIMQHRELQFLELLVTQLLIKQNGGLMRAYDILRGDGFAVSNTANFRPIGFVFYDTENRTEILDPTVSVKERLIYRPRKFFTVSKTCIEFWELSRRYLLRTKQLLVQGMDNPDLCSHSQWANLLFIHAREGPRNTYEQMDTIDALRKNDTRMYIRRSSLRRKSSRVHTPRKGSGGSREVDIFAPNIGPDINNGLLVFSLDGNSFYGRIDKSICGTNLVTMSIKHDLSVGCNRMWKQFGYRKAC
ncbi:hypothetical protein BgAZ_205700 [Babesia gibsoni]|uniref:Uncharacterized protein n=1 Tax=Babesia gibsoni TaxID=33632 RepID=A0AAD8LMQ0_BABGI|nr:hypothetical protein BgAZ_205700 [Babesia gibsoni]